MDAMVEAATKVDYKREQARAQQPSPKLSKLYHGRDAGPQEGPQKAFIETGADIAIFGGQAGGGKTWALLWETIRNLDVPGFGAVIFRRDYTQIRAEGGLWDMSLELYYRWHGIPRENHLDWRFPSGAKIRFAHMQHENDRFSWDGSQVPLICFDQLESFTWKQFIYMLSRNRSMCGIEPYIRATCNPNPDHFLRDFLRWWIDEDTGLAIKERAGIVRWFVNINNEVHWDDTPEAIRARFGEACEPKSCTFIPSSIYDNRILLERNPGYIANLKALSLIDRERLLEGNWNVRETAGMFFQRAWFEIVEAAPALVDEMRYWDRAATDALDKQAATASWTAGVRIGKDARGVFYITDVDRFQGTPLKVKERIKNVATQDGTRVRIGIEQDPAQAGKAEAQDHVRNLAGYSVSVNRVHESKGVRAKPLSAQAEAGNVKIVRAPWNEALLRELQNFDGTDKCTSDQVDAASGAFHLLTIVRPRAGVWGKR